MSLPLRATRLRAAGAQVQRGGVDKGARASRVGEGRKDSREGLPRLERAGVGGMEGGRNIGNASSDEQSARRFSGEFGVELRCFAVVKMLGRYALG